MLRSVGPKVTVKIVDACHSGTPYIKDAVDYDSVFKSLNQVFKECYFLFSSRFDEYSLANKSLSVFTHSILKSIYTTNSSNGIIRYWDVINFLKDDNTLSGSQKPYFVIQSSMSDVFCRQSEKVNSLLSKYFTLVPSTNEYKPSLPEAIINDAKHFMDKNGIESVFRSIRTFAEMLTISTDLSDIYSLDVEFSNIILPKSIVIPIARWLEGNVGEYFATPLYKDVEVRIDSASKGMRDIVPFWASSFTMQPGMFKENKLVGLSITAGMPYEQITITFMNKYPNVPRRSCIILPVVSRTTIQLFYCTINYKKAGWSDPEMIFDNIQWETKSIDFNNENELKNCFKKFVFQTEQNLRDELMRKYFVEMESQGGENSAIEDINHDK